MVDNTLSSLEELRDIEQMKYLLLNNWGQLFDTRSANNGQRDWFLTMPIRFDRSMFQFWIN